MTFAIACMALAFMWPQWQEAIAVNGNYEPCCPPDTDSHSYSAISLTNGTLSDKYDASSVKSASGATTELSFAYKSYNADGSRGQIDTVMGFGWTHSYNIFLFVQGGHVFRMDGQGQIAKFQLNPNGTYTALVGYFETLVRNGPSAFLIRDKNGTVSQFALVANTPFLVQGPVYRLISITDRNFNTTTLSYTNGNLTEITDTYGRRLTLSYNSQNKLATIVDPLGRLTTLEYDPTGRRLTKITDPALNSVQYTYNVLNQITDKIDKDGRRFSYLYQNGKPVGNTDGAGTTVFSLSNPTNWAINETASASGLVREYIPSTTSKIDGRGNVWKNEYDIHGYLTRTIAPDGATTTYTYASATLRLASTTDANGHTTAYEYDASGNRTKVTDALGNVTTYTYEPVFSMMTSMIDPNGRVTRYEYDTKGNRLREIDPLAAIREWTYDGHSNVLTEKNKNGNIAIHSYDAFGNRHTTTDALGNVTTMTYDAVGNLTSRTNARGFTTTYEYDGLNRPIRETDPFSNATQTIYDGQGNRIQLIDRNGNRTFFEYDLRRRLVKTTDALGQMVTQTFDGNDNRTSITDKNGHTTTFQYDVQNRPIKTTDAIGNMTTITYDGVGNKLTETDANGHTTSYRYDVLNRVIGKTDAENNVTQVLYDMVGLAACPQCTGPTGGSRLATKLIDAEGKVTYSKYDSLDRLIIQIRKEGDTADVIDATDAVTRYTYDASGNRLTLREPNGNTMSYVYDPLNRQIKLTNAAGDTTVTTYDQNSNVKTGTAPNLNVTTNTYDALDRLVQVDDVVGRVANYTYDPIGNRLTEKDGNSNGTTHAYDRIYRLTDATDALGRTARYAYDPVGNLLTLTDREGNVTHYAYDDINRRRRMTDAMGNLTRYEYDGVGSLTQITDANKHATDYAYDKINRLITETYANRQRRVFTYDRANNIKTRLDQKGQATVYTYNDLYFLVKRTYLVSPADNMAYDLSGRMLTACRGVMTSSTCAGWLVTFTYDGANRVMHATQNGKAINYVYDIPGRKRTLTYPGGRTISEHTDARSRLGSIDDVSPSLVQYSYDAANRVVSRVYRNLTEALYTYNANNWITSLNHVKADLTRIAGFAQDFDHEGNKRFESKLSDTGGSDARSEAYQYDKIYRLIDFKVGNLVGATVPLPLTQTQYDLDGVGNWNVKTKDGIPEIRVHDAVNEITRIKVKSSPPVPIRSDLNGNLNEDERYRYNYDEENLLASVVRKADNRVVGQYQYDALGRRVVAVTNPAGGFLETRFFYDRSRIIEEQDVAGLTKATYVYGNYIDEVLTMDRAAQTYYYHQNALWSVAAVTNSSANVVERYSYNDYGCVSVTNGAGVALPANSWGTPHSAIANPYLFIGREVDEESGLYYYRARYYDCAKGRFLQTDPLGYGDGLNFYAAYFVPNGVDPLGLCKSQWGESDCKLGKAEWIEEPHIANLALNTYRVRHRFGVGIGGVQFGELTGYFSFDIKWIVNCECVCRCSSSSGPYSYDHDDVVQGGLHLANVPATIPLPRVPWPIPGYGAAKLVARIVYGSVILNDLADAILPYTNLYLLTVRQFGPLIVCEGKQHEIGISLDVLINNKD